MVESQQSNRTSPTDQSLEGRFAGQQDDLKNAPHGAVVLGGESGERLSKFAELARLFPQAQLVHSGASKSATRYIQDLSVPFELPFCRP
jgi:hypothetical protein